MCVIQITLDAQRRNQTPAQPVGCIAMVGQRILFFTTYVLSTARPTLLFSHYPIRIFEDFFERLHGFWVQCVVARKLPGIVKIGNGLNRREVALHLIVSA